MAKVKTTPELLKGLIETYYSFCDGEMCEVKLDDEHVYDDDIYCMIGNEGTCLLEKNREDEPIFDKNAVCVDFNDETSMSRTNSEHSPSGSDLTEHDDCQGHCNESSFMNKDTDDPNSAHMALETNLFTSLPEWRGAQDYQSEAGIPEQGRSSILTRVKSYWHIICINHDAVLYWVMFHRRRKIANIAGAKRSTRGRCTPLKSVS